MKITAQEEYGLRCLLRFARAGVEQWLTIPEIAEAEKLSVPYVAKLLAILRQASVIESSRGRSGGYRLATAPADVRLGSVLRVLGEPLFEEPEFCDRHAGTESEGPCVHKDGCTVRALWRSLGHWMQSFLDRITLADLVQSEQRIMDLFQSSLADSRTVAPPRIRLTPKIGD
jgi:Rrf2 family protein